MLIPFGVLSAAGAGGAGGNYDLIETVILDTAASSVTFSSLATYASTYKHLQIRMAAQITGTATTAVGMNVRLNGDSGSNYAYHVTQGQGTSVASTVETNKSTMIIQNVLPRSSETNKFGAVVIDFLDAYSNSKNTTIRALHGCLSGGEVSIGLSSGLWMNTNALTSIELSQVDLNIGSRFSLYGIRG